MIPANIKHSDNSYVKCWLLLTVYVATKMWCLGRVLPLVIGEWVPEDQPHYKTFLILRTILDITMAPVICIERVMYLRDIIEEHHQRFLECYPEVAVIPKMHYIIHLPQWIMKVGPIVRFWTMRFEGQHKLFKKLSSAMGNFINVAKSLAQRHQEYQCYHQLNKDNFFNEKASVGSTNSKCVADLCYRNKLMEKIPALAEDQCVETTARVEVMGTTYRTGCCLLIGCHLNLPEFAKLQQIVVHCHEIYLVLEVLTTCRFYDHFHSYEVESSVNPATAILMPSELLDFQVLHIHSIRSEVGTVKLITPKYDIDSYCTDR